MTITHGDQKDRSSGGEAGTPARRGRAARTLESTRTTEDKPLIACQDGVTAAACLGHQWRQWVVSGGMVSTNQWNLGVLGRRPLMRGWGRAWGSQTPLDGGSARLINGCAAMAVKAWMMRRSVGQLTEEECWNLAVNCSELYTPSR